MDCTHSAKAKGQHHERGTNMEPIMEASPRETKAYMKEGNGGRDGSRRIQPKAVGEVGPKSCPMEASE